MRAEAYVSLAALGPLSPDYWHLLVEAKKLAYADLYAYNGDPGFVAVPVAKLISKVYAAQLCAHIDMRNARTPEPKGDPVGGTVYLAAADRWGNDGGYTITQRGVLYAPLTLDHLLIGSRYWSTLRAQWSNVRLSLGRNFLSDLELPRRWSAAGRSPFERVRTMDPPVNEGLNAEALRNLTQAWPVFKDAVLTQAWAGMIDVTLDSLPVISSVTKIPGLTLACGFSGHGFGTSPAAGQLAGDLVSGEAPSVDPAPYRLGRL